jgi:hypothetical protein
VAAEMILLCQSIITLHTRGGSGGSGADVIGSWFGEIFFAAQRNTYVPVKIRVK